MLLKTLSLCLCVFFAASLVNPAWSDADVYAFTEADIQFLMNFSIENLPPLPDAPDNRAADNIDAARLGQAIFFDPRFSANGQISCASCHHAEQFFSDNVALSAGLGLTRRNAPSLLGAAYGPWKNWDGSKDSLWAQALGPMEDENEMALSRLDAAKRILQFYRAGYEAVFGKVERARSLLRLRGPASSIGDQRTVANWERLREKDKLAVNRIFSNIGKALMAYQRRLPLPESRFDLFLHALQSRPQDRKALMNILSLSEVRGMRLFMGQARCASCHNGPLFSNFEFHNVGAPEPNTRDVDMGRYVGIVQVADDEFTCLSRWSDAKPGQCTDMIYLKKNGPELVGAFKTPSLRNVAETAPYMQAGQLATLLDVVAHYNRPTPPYYDREQHPSRPHFDIVPLNLSEQQQGDLVAFLHTLTSVVPDDDPWWLLD